MRVLNFEVHNIKKVSDLEVPCEGRHLILIGGKNKAGKSSALDALQMALCGKRGIKFADVPLKEGEDEGHVSIELETGDLSDDPSLTVTRRFERERGGGVKTTLEITDSTGEAAPEPQTLLNSWFNLSGLNPLSIADQTPKEQRTVVMELVGLTELYEQTEAEHDVLYEERRGVNSEGKRAAALAQELKFVKEAGTTEVSVADLVGEITEAEEHNNAVREVKLRAGKADVAVAGKTADITAAEEKLKELKKDLKALKKELKAAVAAAEGQVERPVDEIRCRIADAESGNKAVQSNLKFKEAESRLKELRKDSARLTAELEGIQTRRQDALKEAEWPIPGLGVDSEGLLFNGLPVTQASQAERIRLWCSVSAALNPELRLLIFKNGNDLDPESMKGLGEFLEAQDMQAIIEYVTRSETDEEQCVVVLEEGQVKQNDDV